MRGSAAAGLVGGILCLLRGGATRLSVCNKGALGHACAPLPQVVPGAFIPFGAGSRMCVGMRFAELTARLTLIRLYQQVGGTSKGGRKCGLKRGAGQPDHWPLGRHSMHSCAPVQQAAAPALFPDATVAPLPLSPVHVPAGAGPGATEDQGADHPSEHWLVSHIVVHCASSCSC